MLRKQKIYKKGSLLLIYLGATTKRQMIAFSKELDKLDKYLEKENIGYNDAQYEKVLYTDIDIITPTLFYACIVECDKKEQVISRLRKWIADKPIRKAVRFSTREKQFLIPKPKKKTAKKLLPIKQVAA